MAEILHEILHQLKGSLSVYPIFFRVLHMPGG